MPAAATTKDKVLIVMRELDRRRQDGRLGLTEPVSLKTMAAVSAEIGHPVSERTLGRIERRALAKLKHHPLTRLAFQAFTQRTS